MFADITASVVACETYAICPSNILFFRGLVRDIKQGLTRRTMFTYYCAHIKKTKVDGFRLSVPFRSCYVDHFYTVITGTIVKE